MPPPAPMPALTLFWRIGLGLTAGAAYGTANFISGLFPLPGGTFSELRPQIVVPLFTGLRLGPLAGFLAGLSGDLLGYALSGRGALFAPHWSLANGLAGMIPGLVRTYREHPVDAVTRFRNLLILLSVACCFPFLLAAWSDALLGKCSWDFAFTAIFVPVWITDSLWAFLLIPPLMALCRMFRLRMGMRLVLMVFYLLITTTLIVWLTSMLPHLGNAEAETRHVYLLGAFTLLALLAGLALAAASARKVTEPVASLTEAARRAASGDYQGLPGLEAFVKRPDEIGELAVMFDKMVRAVATREEDLRREVAELRIEIDHRKQQTELERITGTDYFKSLKGKAAALRSGRDKAAEDAS